MDILNELLNRFSKYRALLCGKRGEVCLRECCDFGCTFVLLTLARAMSAFIMAYDCLTPFSIENHASNVRARH